MTMKRIFSTVALTAALALPASAFAGVAIGVNLGGPVYAPPPVVVAPAPIYAPPPPVVYAPRAVYAGPGYYYHRGPRCWWRGGYRVCR